MLRACPSTGMMNGGATLRALRKFSVESAERKNAGNAEHDEFNGDVADT